MHVGAKVEYFVVVGAYLLRARDLVPYENDSVEHTMFEISQL